LIVMPRKNHQNSRRLFVRQSHRLTPKEFLKWLGLYRDFFQVVKRFFRKRLETTSLIIVGSQDHVFLEAAKRYALKQAHKAQLVIIENCGHVCNVEQVDKFNTIVLNFLRNFGQRSDAQPVAIG
ncbi:MAG: alpha/beta hydrolase, partial [Bacteroidota bacterium]